MTAANNTSVLDSIIGSIKQDLLADAIEDSYLLIGSEVNRLAETGRRLLEAGKSDAAISYFDRCYGR